MRTAVRHFRQKGIGPAFLLATLALNCSGEAAYAEIALSKCVYSFDLPSTLPRDPANSPPTFANDRMFVTLDELPLDKALAEQNEVADENGVREEVAGAIFWDSEPLGATAHHECNPSTCFPSSYYVVKNVCGNGCALTAVILSQGIANELLSVRSSLKDAIKSGSFLRICR